jgi:hypothetical protein
MNNNLRLSFKIIGSSVLVVISVMAVLLGNHPIQAQGGLAISGSFYQQVFEIPQGSSIGGPSVNVVVFNNGSESLKIKMLGQSPLGVNIILSKNDFALPSGAQQEVTIKVEVTKDASPGDYDITIVAESSKEGGTGIQLAGAAAQTAKLKVLGESASISLQSVSLDGQAIVAMVRLFRVMDGQNHEVAYSETGKIETKVAPGSFIAISFIGGKQVAEQSFSVASNDKKQVNLAGATIYFESFGIVPNFQKSSGNLAFVQVVYALKNLYQRVPKSEVLLEVKYNGAVTEEVSLAVISPLEMGRAGLNYNYIPAGGWADGDYSLTLKLKLDDRFYSTSQIETFNLSGNSFGAAKPVAAKVEGGWTSPLILGGIGAAIIIIGLSAWLIIRKKRAL